MTTTDDDDTVVGFDLDDMKRILVDIAQHADRPMTQDEIFAKADVLEDDYRRMIFASAMWEAWRRGELSFGVDDGGEIQIHLVDAAEEVVAILDDLVAKPDDEIAALGASIEASMVEASERLRAAGLPAGRSEVIAEAVRLRLEQPE
jgi:hypothetical protein